MSSPAAVTELLLDWSKGNQASLDALTPLIYQELHRLASAHLRRERAGHTLQPTALIHEAYLRMVDQQLPDFNSRAHFFGIATRHMRQILVDHARSRAALKRGAGARQTTLQDAAIYREESPEELVALDVALTRLTELDARKARIVELRYFGGMTPTEIAELTGISVATVHREVRAAEAWLRREIAGHA